MLARTVVLEGESRDRFNELCKSLTDELEPKTAIENLLVQKMAVAHWRQMRFWNIEKASMDHEVGKQSPDLANADPSLRDALALRNLGQSTGQLELRFDRQFERALRVFQRLRELGNKIAPNTTNAAPNVTPNAAPDAAPNLAPNAVPNVAPNVVPNVAPNVVPNVAPNLAPNLAPNVVPNVAPNLAPNEHFPSRDREGAVLNQIPSNEPAK